MKGDVFAGAPGVFATVARVTFGPQVSQFFALGLSDESFALTLFYSPIIVDIGSPVKLNTDIGRSILQVTAALLPRCRKRYGRFMDGVASRLSRKPNAGKEKSP